MNARETYPVVHRHIDGAMMVAVLAATVDQACRVTGRRFIARFEATAMDPDCDRDSRRLVEHGLRYLNVKEETVFVLGPGQVGIRVRLRASVSNAAVGDRATTSARRDGSRKAFAVGDGGAIPYVVEFV